LIPVEEDKKWIIGKYLGSEDVLTEAGILAIIERLDKCIGMCNCSFQKNDKTKYVIRNKCRNTLYTYNISICIKDYCNEKYFMVRDSGHIELYQ
jgi:hypothetical protein